MMEPVSLFEPVPASHPDRLAVIAAMHGLAPAPPAGASVLELACGDGSNLIPMAYHRPDARFVGLEGAALPVVAARDAIARLGLRNVEIVAGDAGQIARRGDRFDYVIVHNVLSRASDEVCRALLELACAVLSEDGVVYVDYLGVSGFLLARRLRDLLRHRVAPIDTARERIRVIRGILAALDHDGLDAHSPHALLARAEVRFARTLTDAGLAELFLSPYHRGLSPTALAALVSPHGLRVFAEGWDPSVDHGTEPRLRAGLEPWLEAASGADDLVELMTGPRAARSALLCRSAARASGDLQAFVRNGSFTARLRTRLPSVLLEPGLEVAFITQSGLMVRTRDAFNKAVLTSLRDAWPGGRSLSELVLEATARLADAGQAPPSEHEVARQARELLSLCAVDAVAWCSGQVPAAASTPEFPAVSALTAWQASRSHLLTDAAHRLIVVDDLTRRLVSRLDGRHDARALASAVHAWLEAGELVVVQPEGATEEPATRAERLVSEALAGLTDAGVLTPDPPRARSASNET